MPAPFRSPLVGSYNQRSLTTPAGKDQFFKACIMTKVVNQAMNSATWYTEKRGGLVAGDTSGAGSNGIGIWKSPSMSETTGGVFAAFGNVTSTIYMDKIIGATVNCGTLSSFLVGFNEAVFGGITYILITAGDGSGWYIASDATANTAYTADGNNSTTITDLKVAGVSSVAGLYVGQKLTAGANIVAGSRIVSINAGAFSAVLDTATTGGAFNDLAITKEIVAKINDADFPTNCVGSFAELDGFIFVMTADGKVYNSDLNSVTSWTASGFISASISTDVGLGCIKHKNTIAAFGSDSIEFFQNTGNPAGSPLSSAPQLASNVGYNGIRGITKNAAGVFFLSGTQTSKLALYKMTDFTPMEIPSQGIDFKASGATGAVNSFPYAGQLIVNIMGTTSYWYSVDNGVFTEPALPAAAYFATTPSAIGNAALCVLTDTSGTIYNMADTTTTFQDGGAAFTMSVQLAIDMGTQKRKFATELRFEGDVQPTGTLDISWSDDDGVTYTTPRSMSLASMSVMKMTRLGSWKGTRLFRFQHSANTAFRGKAIEIDYTLATN